MGSQSAPEVVAEPEPAPEIIDDYEGDGMLLTLDGSSMEAFNASVERVGRHTTEDMYTNLVNAIDYLQLYTLEVRGKKDQLIKHLDGMTGYEVLEQVGWTQAPTPEKSAPISPAINDEA